MTDSQFLRSLRIQAEDEEAAERLPSEPFTVISPEGNPVLVLEVTAHAAAVGRWVEQAEAQYARAQRLRRIAEKARREARATANLAHALWLAVIVLLLGLIGTVGMVVRAK